MMNKSKKITLFCFLTTIAFQQNKALAIPDTCKDIFKYEEFMLKTETLSSDFTQSINEKITSGGVFLMKKPNKMLIDYTTGDVNSTIGINGKIATYLDKDLEQISRIPESKTPAYYILSSKVKLSDMKIESCEDGENFYSVIFKEENSFASGKFEINFTKDASSIKSISILDKSGQKTQINFTNQVRNLEISDKKFVIKDPNL